jgi:hypothetical protein
MIAGYARRVRNIHAAWILSQGFMLRAELSLALRQGDVVPTSCRKEAARELPDYHVHRLAELDFLRMETAYWYHE